MPIDKLIYYCAHALTRQFGLELNAGALTRWLRQLAEGNGNIL